MNAPPPPPPPPSDEELKKIKGKAKYDENNKNSGDVEIDLEKYFTPYDIRKQIDWNSINRAKLSEDNMGGDGVFFLQAGNDEIFVVKGSFVLADEIFSSRISHFLGIRSPYTLLIEYKPSLQSEKRHPESELYGNNWFGTKKALRRCGENNLRVKLKIERTFAFYLLMEFIPGQNMFSSKFDLGILSSRKHLNDIGRIFVFDLIQNNSDRFPIPDIFVNEGNPQNFLFLENEVVAIDQAVSPIKDEEFRKKYLLELEKVVKVHQEKGVFNHYIESIVRFLKYNIIRNEEVKIDEDGRREIWRGMDDVFRIVTDGKSLNLDVLKRTKEDVRKMRTGEDWKNVFQESLDRIDCEFLGEILEVIKRNYKRNID